MTSIFYFKINVITIFKYIRLKIKGSAVTNSHTVYTEN